MIARDANTLPDDRLAFVDTIIIPSYSLYLSDYKNVRLT